MTEDKPQPVDIRIIADDSVVESITDIVIKACEQHGIKLLQQSHSYQSRKDSRKLKYLNFVNNFDHE